MFAEASRRAGNDVALLLFEGAEHGGGGLNCAVGREAVLAFLSHHRLLPSSGRDFKALGPKGEGDASEYIRAAMRTFGVTSDEYETARYAPRKHARASLRLKALRVGA